MNSLLLNKIARAALLAGGIIGSVACAMSCKNSYENQKETLMLEHCQDDDIDDIIDVEEFEEIDEEA